MDASAASDAPELPRVFEIVDHHAILGDAHQDSMFATTSDPRFLPGPTDGSSKALHAGSMEDLQRHFFAIADPSDCTEAWVRRNEEIFAASFAKKCISELLTRSDGKFREALTKEFSSQQNIRLVRKELLRAMPKEQRREQKAKFRFLRTAVNFPKIPGSDAPLAAKMLITEFDILMRQCGVRIASRAQLQSLFEAVKADKKDRNYITLEQFLAFYRDEYPKRCLGPTQIRKWKFVRSGEYDMLLARMAIIRYCNKEARARGKKIFRGHLSDYRFLWELMFRVVAEPDTPRTEHKHESTEHKHESTEHKTETPLSDIDVGIVRPTTPPRYTDTLNSNYSQRMDSEVQREERARRHDLESKQLSDVPVLSKVAADDAYTLTAFLGDAYTDGSECERVDERAEEFDSNSVSLSEQSLTDDEILSEMFGRKDRANSTSAQRLIDSLLNFSEENLANHVEMHSPRETEM